MTLKRYYCIFRTQSATAELYYTQQWRHQKKLIPWKTIQLPDRGQNLNHYLNEQLQSELVKIQHLKLSQQFWQLANQNLKTALLLSIYLRRIHSRGVFNVITDDWLKDKNFKQIHQDQQRWLQDWQWRKIIERIMRSLGLHQKSLRFDQIHLAEDNIGQKKYYSVHYDLHNNNHLKKIGLIKHLLFEDGKNQKLN